MQQDTDIGPTAIDTSICVHVDDVAPHPFTLLNGAPVSARPLRRYADGLLRSAQLSVPAGWSSAALSVVDATIQIFLIAGQMSADDDPLGDLSFVCIPAGSRAPSLVAQTACAIIVILDLPAAPSTASTLIISDVLAIEPFTPVISGRRLEGFERRVLWLDPVTGADTRLLRVPAGFRGASPNWHPVHEEIFCISGDIAPDATRPMRAGSFLWNQARSIHGFDEHTIGGCMLLEWHDGPWNLFPTPDAVRPG